uniref:Tripartite motif-containing protein 29-like n=1 Tax=Erpetoichthys calabaricus TaxID=27687 RepID=A0A8C4XF29_ERPCA
MQAHLHHKSSENLKRQQSATHPAPQTQNYPGDMECDACTGKKFLAVKSCLTCMASFCQTHLQPHFEIAAWKDHKLIDPDRHLQEKLCAAHQKSLEIFCKTDETCICLVCVVTGHKGHEMVELEAERREKQKQLGTTLSEIRKRLEKKEKTLKETRRALEQIKISAERQVQEHEKNFTDLIRCIQKTRRKLTERIREHENREREKAKVVMERLEKEIEELKIRNAELKELSETKDNFHFLQTFSSRCVLPADGDSTSFTITADFSFEDLSKKVSSLKKSLEKMSQWHILPFTPPGNEVSRFVLLPPDPQSREEFLQYFCPLTLDINTPHRELHLSEGNKKVTWEETEAKYPDHPDRFDWWPQVLCGEALTGTRCYWEVEGSGEDMEIGVAYKGLGRKGESSGCHLGYNDKSWSLAWCNSRYSVCHNNKETVISAPYSPRVGVYLDWPDGSLSFYSVTQTMTILHKFNTCFTERLYPGFGVGPDSSVTICHLMPSDY